jgi:fructose-1,6-bisphosphatase/inositol monophosphatase family enzyme
MAENTCFNKLFRICDTIEEAIGKILPMQIFSWNKIDTTPITNIDIALQTAIVNIIQSLFAEDNIICEEDCVIRNPHSLYTWVVDPIDGTSNFIENRKEFSISVGLMRKTEFIEAFLLFPRLNERYYASRGSGIWKNGIPFLPIQSPSLECTRNIILCSKTYNKFKSTLESKGFTVLFFNCATYSLLMLLKGLSFIYHTINTMIYDVGPMSLIVKEAGIKLVNEKRSDLIFSPDLSVIPFFLAISDEERLEEIYELIS